MSVLRPSLPSKKKEQEVKTTIEKPRPMVAILAVNSALSPVPPAVPLNMALE